MPDAKHVILCVDDDQDVLTYLRLTLESAGYQVVTAETAEEGIKVYKQARPALVIVDLMMEEVDAGTQLCKALQALQNQAPVYVLSSVGDDMQKTVDTAEFGISGVFQKPLDRAALLKIISAKLK
jgi:two-component system, NtrC family, response regulator GlrR